MEAFSDVVYAIYEASLTPDKWPAALSTIGARFGAEGAVVIFYRRNEPAEFIFAPEMKPAVDVYLEGQWWKQDLHAIRAVEHQFRDGDVFSDFTIATPEEIDTHPIYTEFFAQVGFGWLMSAVMLPDLDQLVCLSVPRAKANGPFTPAEMAMLRDIGRHVEQSLRIALRIANLEASQLALLTALDAVASGLYVLDVAGRLLLANKHGREHLDAYFTTADGALAPRSKGERARFAAMVAAAGLADPAGVPPRSCSVTAEDGTRMATWAVPLTATSKQRIGVKDQARTLVLAVPLERSEGIDPAVVRDVFGLSLGEARLASLIGRGMAMQQAADKLGITQGTARAVLKRVFAKLGINRQAQLVLQLSKLRDV